MKIVFTSSDGTGRYRITCFLFSVIDKTDEATPTAQGRLPPRPPAAAARPSAAAGPSRRGLFGVVPNTEGHPVHCRCSTRDKSPAVPAAPREEAAGDERTVSPGERPTGKKRVKGGDECGACGRGRRGGGGAWPRHWGLRPAGEKSLRPEAEAAAPRREWGRGHRRDGPASPGLPPASSVSEDPGPAVKTTEGRGMKTPLGVHRAHRAGAAA